MPTRLPPPVRFALVGAGRIGTHHATTLARRLPEAELVVVADPAPGAAARLAEPLGAAHTGDVDAVLADDRVEAVAIASSSTVHAELVQRVHGGTAAGSAKPGSRVRDALTAGTTPQELVDDQPAGADGRVWLA